MMWSFKQTDVVLSWRARLALACLLGVFSTFACAATFLLPTDGSNIVGQFRVVTADKQNTLLDIARHFDLGYNEITGANKGVSIWLPGAGTLVNIPTQYILPAKPWTGIVINIAQRRLFYFPTPEGNSPATVVTYPIGIARIGWATPLGATRIVAKKKDPSWTVPKDILEEHRNDDDEDFPGYFPPGPNNPMGMYALLTGFSQIYIHGTNRPWGVGMEVSHGCIHLYPEDAASLFESVSVGTPVTIIDQAVQVGHRGQMVYLNISTPSDDKAGEKTVTWNAALDAVFDYYSGQGTKLPPINLKRLKQYVDTPPGMPSPISIGSPTVDGLVSLITPIPYTFPPYSIDANDASTPPGAQKDLGR